MMIFVVVRLSMLSWVLSMPLRCLKIPGSQTQIQCREKAKKVHATLSDFDCACILGSNKLRESQTIGGEITVRNASPARRRLTRIKGTSMFISRALCLLPSEFDALMLQFGWGCKQVFPGGLTGVNQRQQEVTAFLQVARQLDRDAEENYKRLST